MSAHGILKDHTAAAHAVVDAAFSHFDLRERESYVSFLLAHARVLPVIEGALIDERCLPLWQPRASLLMRDLDTFGCRPPGSLFFAEIKPLAEKIGLLYVLEGSRLGGRVLLGRVGTGFSSDFLSATHKPGEWRRFLQTLNELAEVENEAWLKGVLAGARHGFQLYIRSVIETFSNSKSSKERRFAKTVRSSLLCSNRSRTLGGLVAAGYF
jgi:heme oxygenase